MTVLQYFMDQASLSRQCANKAETKRMSESHAADAAKWDRRAKLVTSDIAGMQLDEVILWRVIEEIDKRR